MGSNEPTFSYEKGSSLFCITIIVLTNSYGHPHKETLARLSKFTKNAKVFRTDESGQVSVEVENGRMIIKRFIKN